MRKLSKIEKSAHISALEVNEEALGKINRQSLLPLKAEEVFAFRLEACNNAVDRDHERFTEGTLAAMAAAYVGKPLIKDHTWSADKQVGRVFDAGVEEAQGRKRLILSAYIPRGGSADPTIAAVAGGVLREASVGCAVKRNLCSICGKNYLSEECSHRRGREYAGKTCHVELDGLADCYEVSLVAVPSQPAAGVVKRYEDKEARPQNEAAQKTLTLRARILTARVNAAGHKNELEERDA